MIREETGTDDGILVSERKGGSVAGQARSIWTENGRRVSRWLSLPLDGKGH